MVKFLLIFLLFPITSYANEILELKVRKTRPIESRIIEKISKYHDLSSISDKIELVTRRKSGSENYSVCSKEVISNDTDNETIHTFNPMSNLLHFTRGKGRGDISFGYYAVDGEDVFKFEKNCGTSKCTIHFYKNGEVIY